MHPTMQILDNKYIQNRIKTSQNFLLKYHTKLVMRHQVELAQNNIVVLNNDATMSNLPQATMS